MKSTRDSRLKDETGIHALCAEPVLFIGAENSFVNHLNLDDFEKKKRCRHGKARRKTIKRRIKKIRNLSTFA